VARPELIDAACAWGWDRPSSASVAAAEAALASAPERARTDFLTACLAGEVEVVRRQLDADPGLARSKLPPRGWEPLLYLSYCVLLGRPERAPRLLEVASLLLDRRADPDAHYAGEDPDTGVFPALYAAIAVSRSLPLARLLLEAGADPDDGQSMYHAAEAWTNDAVDLLVEHGASQQELSYCLLHKIDFNHEPGIRRFLEHGADPNLQHPAAGETSLHWAIKRTCPPSVIQLLLDSGADASARTREGHTAHPEITCWTPLDLSERLGRTDVSAVLRAHGGERAATSTLDDFLIACARGDEPAARAFLAAEPDLMSRLSAFDRALLPNVAQQNAAAGVLLMLDLGFDADAPGWGGSTALHWAACRGNPALVKGILARGVRPVDLGGEAGTPIHQALYHRWNDAGDYVGVLEALVAGGVPLPADLRPSGDATLDAAVARLRAG
jgi:ankyrin repeat protein